MLKKVRRRPTHNTRLGARKGVVYLPKDLIGSMIKVLTEKQYKDMCTQIKRLKSKIYKVRKVIHEYVGFGPGN